jgi:hypothetical protein
MTDRQLNQSAYHFYRVNDDVLRSQGWTYVYSVVAALDPGEVGLLSFTTGKKPVTLNDFSVLYEGTGDLIIDTYVGGTITGGVPVDGLPLNHDTPKDPPFAEYIVGGTVTVDGIQIGHSVKPGSSSFGMEGGDQGGGQGVPPFTISQTTASGGDDAAGGQASGTIFARHQHYYILLTNVVPPDTFFQGNWNYLDAGGTPNVGEARHSGNSRTISISYTDDDAGDRQAEIDSLFAGARIEINGFVWTITAAVPDVGFSALTVTPTVKAPPFGVGEFTFQTLATPTAIDLDISLIGSGIPPADLL